MTEEEEKIHRKMRKTRNETQPLLKRRRIIDARLRIIFFSAGFWPKKKVYTSFHNRKSDASVFAQVDGHIGGFSYASFDNIGWNVFGWYAAETAAIFFPTLLLATRSRPPPPTVLICDGHDLLTNQSQIEPLNSNFLNWKKKRKVALPLSKFHFIVKIKIRV